MPNLTDTISTSAHLISLPCHLGHITCSPHHMFPTSHVPHITCSPHHVFPTSRVPHITCSPHHMFPTSHVPHITSSPHHMFPTSIPHRPSCHFSKFLKMHICAAFTVVCGVTRCGAIECGGFVFLPSHTSSCVHACDLLPAGSAEGVGCALPSQGLASARHWLQRGAQRVAPLRPLNAPNELLLFDLSSGSHRPLQGHACQIQAVEYAMDGDVILSCGGSTLKDTRNT
ncbi:unnamed protein product [Closterium sp. Naga37s-1]|nr:unnamed protein product [Closterium sp. Naga37s-1]